MKKVTRREMLRRSALAAGAIISIPAYIPVLGASQAAKIEIERIQYVSNQPGIAYGWPTVGRRADNGELLVSCSGGRQGHVCPFGRVDLFRSYDDGKTWSWPQTIYDGPTDDRDSGLLVTDKGTLLVTTFTSDYYTRQLKREEELRKRGKGQWTDEKFEQWQAAHRRINDTQRKKEMGHWLFRSTDDGINWGVRQSVIPSAPHGPVQGFNGRLLYFGTGHFAMGKDVFPLGVCQSTDDGVTWSTLSIIPTQEFNTPDGRPPFWTELHGIELSPGKLLVHIRNEDINETWQTESQDDGKTWTKPHAIGVWGLPSHLIKLKDGRLLMSYGYRRDPYRNQVRLSSDEGKTWSEPMMLSEPGPKRDLGYPSSVQMPDGSLITVWYEKCPDDELQSVRLAHWKLA